MPPSPSLECPWCETDHADGAALRVHLMVEHRKSDLASFVEERLIDDARPELAVR